MMNPAAVSASSTGGEAVTIELGEIFQDPLESDAQHLIDSPAFIRSLPMGREDGVSLLCDYFTQSQASACFLRILATEAMQANICLGGGYQLDTCLAGGWLLTPADPAQTSYWIPQPPHLRTMDQDGHILSHCVAQISGTTLSASKLGLSIEIPAKHSLDIVVWRLPANEPDLILDLQSLNNLEKQRYFLWSSHTAYSRPSDLYLHLVNGHIYENHSVWPRYWRVCSELDAYALYVTLSGLLRATGKRLYDLLRTQVVFSVIHRQSSDGGWYHGEWTDGMESHYRLHAGGMHMLAAYCEETHDPQACAALKLAATFAAAKTDRLDAGMWYLHDSLEQDAETLKKYPFRHAPSQVLGKSISNLLVLNTHLDTNIAMERHRRISGDDRHAELINSARATSRSVLALRSAEWLYRPIFRAIGLTFLPTRQASALPLHLRAIKRIAWKYLLPLLPRIKARFPRLVMPGGFIERDLAQYGLSARYQPVNTMDLIRTRRLFDETGMDALIEESFAFTQKSGIKERWKEFKGKEDDSLGFWAESLYHLCLAEPSATYRIWLAEAMMDLEDNKLGQSPSLLGGNSEAVSPAFQHPCPSPSDARLRLANLGRESVLELLIINPAHHSISLQWERAPDGPMDWSYWDGTMRPVAESRLEIPARGWLHGITGPRDTHSHVTGPAAATAHDNKASPR